MVKHLKHLKQHLLPTIAIWLISFYSAPLLAESKNSWHVDMDLSTQSDDNIGQAQERIDIIEDSIVKANVSTTYEIPIDDLQAISIGASLSGEAYKEVDTLNNNSLGLQVAFLWQNRLGYTAPLFRLSFDLQELDSDSDDRDSTIMETMLTVSSNFTDTMSGTFGLSHKNQDSESDVFDLKNNRLFISLDHALGRNGTLYLTGSAIRGEVFSISRADAGSSGNGIDINIESYYPALNAGNGNIQWDEAFNTHYQPVNKWRAYRSDGDTQVAVIGYNHGFGHGFAIDISALAADVDADTATYKRQIFSGSLLKRF